MNFEQPEQPNIIRPNEQVARKMVPDAYVVDMQKRNTGQVIEHIKSEDPSKPNQIIVSFPAGKRSFANLGEMTQWAKENYGIINDETGKHLVGETVEQLKKDGRL